MCGCGESGAGVCPGGTARERADRSVPGERFTSTTACTGAVLEPAPHEFALSDTHLALIVHAVHRDLRQWPGLPAGRIGHTRAARTACGGYLPSGRTDRPERAGGQLRDAC